MLVQEGLTSHCPRFQKSELTCCWVTLLPLVEQVPHHHRAGPRYHCFPVTACPLVGWSGHSALKLGLAEWFITFLLSTGCLLLLLAATTGESSGPFPRCTTENRNAAHAANETVVKCEVLYFTTRYNIYGSAGQLPRVLAAAARGGIFQPWNTLNFAQSFFSFSSSPRAPSTSSCSACWGWTPRTAAGWGCRPWADAGCGCRPRTAAGRGCRPRTAAGWGCRPRTAAG